MKVCITKNKGYRTIRS